MDFASLRHIRVILLCLLGFIAVSVFRNASYLMPTGLVYSHHNTETENTTPRPSNLRIVTVPRRHLSDLATRSGRGNVSDKLPAPSSKSDASNAEDNALDNEINKSGIKGHVTVYQPKERQVTRMGRPRGKRPPIRKPKFPVGARLRRSEKPIFSKIRAAWPPAIEWPEPWMRPATSTSEKDSRNGSAVKCDMNTLSKLLRPKLPKHFEIRTFESLPARYKFIAQPRSQPECGNSGLPYPWKLLKQASEHRKIWTLFVVKSAPAYDDNRETVRETWGAQENFPSHQIFVLFVVGRTNDKNVTENLRRENEKHGDLLQCDFLDHYHKLPIKVLSTFRWMLERDFDVDFFTMTDDDCLVNLPRFAAFFDKNVTTQEDYYKNVYCGFRFQIDAPANRKDIKWMVTREEYSEDFYPSFCHGGLWTLSRPLMHGLYCMSEITEIGDFFLEDVFITGILREKLNFKETNIKRMVRNVHRDRSTMVYHAGFKKTAESARAKMMHEWELWRENWEKAIRS